MPDGIKKHQLLQITIPHSLNFGTPIFFTDYKRPRAGLKESVKKLVVQKILCTLLQFEIREFSMPCGIICRSSG